MKTKIQRISNPFRKGNQYTRRKLVQMYSCIAFLFALCFLLDFVMGGSIFSMGGAGISLASMALIGNIKDVSDRFTHGSNIAYQVYLIDVNQVDPSKKFPLPNSNREVGQVPMRPGEYMHYLEAHDIPTYTGTGEKGDITTSGTNTFAMVMGGVREQLLNFQEEYAGGKFIIIFHEIGSDDWYIIGSVDRPMIFSSFEAKNDKDGRYVTFTFTRTSIDQYYKYTGALVTVPAGKHKADQTTLAVTAGVNTYTIPDGSVSTYAISDISGITASDKGRHITLEGAGTGDNAATIDDGTHFILEDAATWTAKAGSRITFLVLDADTLVEVQGSRIQTA